MESAVATDEQKIIPTGCLTSDGNAFEFSGAKPTRSGEMVRYSIYQMLVDGNSPCIVAKRLRIRPSNVYYHQVLLEKSRIIVRVGPGTPIIFTKGKRAAQYEDDIKRRLSGQIEDDGVLQFKTYFVSRTHAVGRITYRVLKLGDVHSYVVKRADSKNEVALFPKCSERVYNGSIFYDTKVPHDGYDVSIQLQITDENCYLYIWPHEVLQTRSEIIEGSMPFKKQCKEIVANLTKYAGWEIEAIDIDPPVHYALVLGVGDEVISTDFRAPNAWADRSTGKLEIETDNKDVVLEWLSYPQSDQ